MLSASRAEHHVCNLWLAVASSLNCSLMYDERELATCSASSAEHHVSSLWLALASSLNIAQPGEVLSLSI